MRTKGLTHRRVGVLCAVLASFIVSTAYTPLVYPSLEENHGFVYDVETDRALSVTGSIEVLLCAEEGETDTFLPAGSQSCPDVILFTNEESVTLQLLNISADGVIRSFISQPTIRTPVPTSTVTLRGYGTTQEVIPTTVGTIMQPEVPDDSNPSPDPPFSPNTTQPRMLPESPADGSPLPDVSSPPGEQTNQQSPSLSSPSAGPTASPSPSPDRSPSTSPSPSSTRPTTSPSPSPVGSPSTSPSPSSTRPTTSPSPSPDRSPSTSPSPSSTSPTTSPSPSPVGSPSTSPSPSSTRPTASPSPSPDRSPSTSPSPSSTRPTTSPSPSPDRSPSTFSSMAESGGGSGGSKPLGGSSTGSFIEEAAEAPREDVESDDAVLEMLEEMEYDSSIDASTRALLQIDSDEPNDQSSSADGAIFYELRFDNMPDQMIIPVDVEFEPGVVRSLKIFRDTTPTRSEIQQLSESKSTTDATLTDFLYSVKLSDYVFQTPDSAALCSEIQQSLSSFSSQALSRGQILTADDRNAMIRVADAFDRCDPYLDEVDPNELLKVSGTEASFTRSRNPFSEQALENNALTTEVQFMFSAATYRRSWVDIGVDPSSTVNLAGLEIERQSTRHMIGRQNRETLQSIDRAESLGTASTVVLGVAIGGSIVLSVGGSVASAAMNPSAAYAVTKAGAGSSISSVVDLLGTGQRIYLFGRMSLPNKPENYDAYSNSLKWTMLRIDLPWKDDTNEDDSHSIASSAATSEVSTNSSDDRPRRRSKTSDKSATQSKSTMDIVEVEEEDDPYTILASVLWWALIVLVSCILMHIGLIWLCFARKINLPDILRFPRLEIEEIYATMPGIVGGIAALFAADSGDVALGVLLLICFPIAFILWNIYMLQDAFFSRHPTHYDIFFETDKERIRALPSVSSPKPEKKRKKKKKDEEEEADEDEEPEQEEDEEEEADEDEEPEQEEEEEDVEEEVGEEAIEEEVAEEIEENAVEEVGELDKEEETAEEGPSPLGWVYKKIIVTVESSIRPLGSRLIALIPDANKDKIASGLERYVLTPLLGPPFDEGAWKSVRGPQGKFLARYGPIFERYRHVAGSRSGVTYDQDPQAKSVYRGRFAPHKTIDRMRRVRSVMRISAQIIDMAFMVLFTCIVLSEGLELDSSLNNAQAVSLLVITTLYWLLLRVFRPHGTRYLYSAHVYTRLLFSRADLAVALFEHANNCLILCVILYLINDSSADDQRVRRIAGTVLMVLTQIVLITKFLHFTLKRFIQRAILLKTIVLKKKQKPPVLEKVFRESLKLNENYLAKKYFRIWMERTYGHGFYRGRTNTATGVLFEESMWIDPVGTMKRYVCPCCVARDSREVANNSSGV